MTYSLTWLPGVLRGVGLKVVEVSGWESRGHGDMGAVRGVLLHHCAGPLHQSVASMEKILIDGRPDLAGPLAQLGLQEDGTYYVIAAGKAWHAGPGAWQGVTAGNSSFIGIEAVNTGLPGDPWDTPQMDAYLRGVAAILKHIGAPAIMAAGHKEYALPKGRKSDPSFNCVAFRAGVSALLAEPARVGSSHPIKQGRPENG